MFGDFRTLRAYMRTRFPLLALSLIAALTSVPVSEVAEAEVAIPIETLNISGHGWGHGRGMSQYGSLGYASVDHWTSTEILDHYYGGTTSGPIPSAIGVNPNAVRVDLTYMQGAETIVAIGSGRLELVEPDGSTIRDVAANAVRLRVSQTGFTLQTGATCSGPWGTPETLDEATVQVRSEVSGQSNYDRSNKEHLLKVCGAQQHAWYEGAINATSYQGSSRTVNVVPVETYLRGVVPNEIVASWPEATLQAQAVAARSYLLSGDSRHQPYADTCDYTRCQVYDGVFSTRKYNDKATHPRTDQAILDTAGIVRITRRGTVARTEFSSSSGGYTAGGDFLPVLDTGDGIGPNRNHSWNVNVGTSELEAYYDAGRLIGVEVTKRNGYGDFGGRATEVVFRFETRTVTVSGNTARVRLGLKSDWFKIN